MSRFTCQSSQNVLKPLIITKHGKPGQNTHGAPSETAAVLVKDMPLTLNTPGVVAVDDANPSVNYQPPGGWLTAGVTEEFDTTTHGTTVDGSSATISFRGTSIAVYGTLGPEGTPVSTYALDDSSAVTFNAPSVAAPIHQTLFYQSPTLPDGDHRLVVTFLQNSIFWLDYFLYLPSTPSAPPSAPPSSPPSSSPSPPPSHPSSSPNLPTTPPSPAPPSSAVFPSTTSHITISNALSTSAVGGPLLTTGISTTPTSSALALQTSSPVVKQSVSVGAIVGGTLGAALVLLLGAVFFLLYRQRHRDNVDKNIQGLVSSEVDPFPVSQSRHTQDYSITQTSRKTGRPSIIQPSIPSPESKPNSFAYNRSERAEPADRSSMEPPMNTSSPAQSSSGTGQSRVRLHQDGGVRIAGGAPDEPRPLSPATTVDIPPVYGRY